MDDHSGNRVKLPFAVGIFPSRRPHLKKSRFRNRGNFRLSNPESGKIRLAISESWALKSGIQLKESVIPLTIGIRNPSVTDKEPGLQLLEPESTAWNPESKTVFIWISLHTRSIFPLLFCSFVIGVYLERLRFIINLFKLSDHLAGHFRDRMFCVSLFQLW